MATFLRTLDGEWVNVEFVTRVYESRHTDCYLLRINESKSCDSTAPTEVRVHKNVWNSYLARAL